MDIPKFLIAENPMASEQIFILYTGTPTLMFEAICLNDENPFDSVKSENICFYINPDGILEQHYLLLTSVYGHLDDKLNKITKRAIDWYGSYLKFEDAEMDGLGEVLNLKDFNKDVKGLKVVWTKFNNLYYIIYNGKSMSFPNNEELDRHLKEIFRVNKLSDGIINEIDAKIEIVNYGKGNGYIFN